MNISELNSEQRFNLMLAVEHCIKSQIAYLKGIVGMCPWCGQTGIHHEDCNVNKAILWYIEAYETDNLGQFVLLKFADELAERALKELRFISDSGYMFLTIADIKP